MEKQPILIKGFFQRFYSSLFVPKLYPQIIKEPLSKAIGYVLWLCFLIGFLQSMTVFGEIKTLYDNTVNLVNDEKFPDLMIQNGKLQLAPDYQLVLDSGPDFMAILDNTEQYNYLDLKSSRYGIFINSEFIFIQSPNYTELIFSFERFQDFQLPKTLLQNFLRTSRILSYVFLFLFSFLAAGFQYFFRAFIIFMILLFTFPIVRVKELGIKKSQVFIVILYAMSLVNLLFEMFYFIGNNNPILASLLVIVFYMISLKMTQAGIIAILIDKTNGQFHSFD